MWKEKPWKLLFTSVLLQALLLAGVGTCRVLVSSLCPKPRYRTPKQAGNVLYRHQEAGAFGLGTMWRWHLMPLQGALSLLSAKRNVAPPAVGGWGQRVG